MKSKKISLFATFLTVSSFVFVVPVKAANIKVQIVEHLINEFINAGFKKPAVNITDKPQLFELKIDGFEVDHTLFLDNASFTADLDLKYWEGNVQFSQTDGYILNNFVDSVTAAITLKHRAKDNYSLVHTVDDLTGNLFQGFLTTTLKNGDPAVKFGGEVDHLPRHTDKYYDGLFNVTGIKGSKQIMGWNFILNAQHIPSCNNSTFNNTSNSNYSCGVQNPEPLTILGAGAGLGFIGLFGKIASKRKKKDSPEV